MKLSNLDFASEINHNMDQYNKALQALHNIRNICMTDQCNKNYDLMLGTITARIDRAGVVSKMNQHKTHTEPLGPAASALEPRVRVCYEKRAH